jgi:hypothetical protein
MHSRSFLPSGRLFIGIAFLALANYVVSQEPAPSLILSASEVLPEAPGSQLTIVAVEAPDQEFPVRQTSAPHT